MRKLNFILTIFIILLVSQVFGGYIWSQESNAGQNLGGSNRDFAYASNIANQFENISYSLCNLDGAGWSPVVADMNNDNVGDLIFISGTTMRIYTQDCSLIQTITLRSSLKAGPVIENFDGDSYQEILIIDSENITAYEYDGSLVAIDYEKVHGISDVDKFSCDGTLAGCIIVYESDDTYYYNYTADTITEYLSELPTTVVDLDLFNTGMTTVYNPTDLKTYTPLCGKNNLVTTEFNCYMLNDNAQYNSVNVKTASASTAISAEYYISSFVAKVGSLYRWFVNVEYKKSSLEHGYQVYTLDGTQVFDLSSLHLDIYNKSSNWMIADYDMDGLNDACIVTNRTQLPSNDLFFECYSSAFGTPSIEWNLTPLGINITKNMVLADFNASEDTLGLASVEGIFYPDYVFFQSNVSVNSNMSGLVVSNPTSGVPSYMVCDATLCYVYYNSDIFTNCGDGVCGDYENEFSCPADCRNITYGSCIVDADCDEPYPVCLLSQCVRVDAYNIDGNYYRCVENSDCPYQAPACWQTYCITALLNDTENNVNSQTNTGDYEANIKTSVNIITGGNSFVKLLIALFVIIAVVIGVHLKTKSDLISLVCGFIATAFFVIFDFIPVYVIIVIVLGVFALWLLVRSFTNKNGGE